MELSAFEITCQRLRCGKQCLPVRVIRVAVYRLVQSTQRLRVMTQLHEGTAQSLQPGPALRVTRRDTVRAAKPSHCFSRLSEIELVQPHFLIKRRLAGIAGDQAFGCSNGFGETAARPQQETARFQHYEMIRR